MDSCCFGSRDSGVKIRRLLIANRGEIAMRIIETCRSLGIGTVLVVSEADKDALPARQADELVCVGAARPGESYLKIGAIVQAAISKQVDAIHPGYGFLSENSEFARACIQNNIVFIGPLPEQLESLGDKLKARECAIEAGVPVTPGAAVTNVDEALELAESITYPILIKAVSGGGGKGMKRVNSEAQMEEAVSMAISEAQASFADPRIYLERYVASGRHVEVQVLGDGHTTIHLGDRDCSIQRRFQKLLEEAPASDISDELRESMRLSAVKLANSLQYRGLGTVEFLLDSQRQEFYFLEMNARIQVEHPVTEMVTGIDLVAEQIHVAEGRPLGLRQSDIKIDGHAFECRINAEDGEHDFRPSPGTVTQAKFPEGLRVDTHIQAGETISPFYDSMIAKIIAHGVDRQDALNKMRVGLANTCIEGVITNIPLHWGLLNDQDFGRAAVDTGFLQDFLDKQRPLSQAD